MGLKFLNFELQMLCVMNCKKIFNQQCNRHLHFSGQHYSFQGYFQTFPYLWSFSRLFKALEISTLNSRTFHTFPGFVLCLLAGMSVFIWAMCLSERVTSSHICPYRRSMRAKVLTHASREWLTSVAVFSAFVYSVWFEIVVLQVCIHWFACIYCIHFIVYFHCIIFTCQNN